ncbi:ArgK protein-domain-containing protein [Phlyctochytrium arcticum]|nr:ArgK protein-domain-containing protein [Phlyctochytrium arcticum]
MSRMFLRVVRPHSYPLRQYASSATSTLSIPPKVQKLFDGLKAGDRQSLARAITLVESTRSEHREETQKLLALVLAQNKLPRAKSGVPETFKTTFRIGLSGSPGVGKSSFIETFGMFLIEQGHRVAVLAVDPSSSRTGGSILGDKTRMTEMSKHPNAYVRPSPSSCTLGGVARNTNEAIILCEAGGYDVILVETVGVGQSETMVSEMTDMFTLLVAPGGGDELQGLKKGIVELSDLILVNKSDGDMKSQANTAVMEYTSALKFVMSDLKGWHAEVIPVSSHHKINIEKTWDAMKRFYSTLEKNDQLTKKRGEQSKKWMWRGISDELSWRLKQDKVVNEMIQSLEHRVYDGELTPGQAAEQVLEEFLDRQKSKR